MAAHSTEQFRDSRSGSCLQELSAPKCPQYVLADQTQVTYITKPISTLTCKQQSLLKIPKLEKSDPLLKSQALQNSQQLLRIAEFLNFKGESESHTAEIFTDTHPGKYKAIHFNPVAFNRAFKHLKHVPKTILSMLPCSNKRFAKHTFYTESDLYGLLWASHKKQ